MVGAGSETGEVLHKSILAMAEAQKLTTKEGLEKSIAEATKSLKKFSEFRALSDIILEILHTLLTALGGEGIDAFVSQGGLKFLLDHVKRNQFHAKTQINAFRILGEILQAKPGYADAVRNAGEREKQREIL